VQDFRDWLRVRGMLFPLRSVEFGTYLQRFSETHVMRSGMSVKDQMWLDESGNLQATFVQFMIALSYTSTPANVVLPYKERWDMYLQGLNKNAPMDAGEAWHTSTLWIRAEAEQAIVDSTLNTLLVSVGCGFLGALFFSHGDVALSGLVVLAVVGVTICLAWFMSVVMGWAIGAIEVIGLIVFVGYSITYSLHVAHKYREHIQSTKDCNLDVGMRRHKAVRYALMSMTRAVLGSALTTIGSSFFLFFCVMQIFVKLAAILFAVTSFATLFATVALPSALLCIGPSGPCCETLFSGLSFEDPDDNAAAADHELASRQAVSDPCDRSDVRCRTSPVPFEQPAELETTMKSFSTMAVCEMLENPNALAGASRSSDRKEANLSDVHPPKLQRLQPPLEGHSGAAPRMSDVQRAWSRSSSSCGVCIAPREISASNGAICKPSIARL